jgi:hypothetical protein
MRAQRKLSDIADAIINQGSIDAEQVKEIRLEIFSETRVIERMLDDGIVDRQEAEMLFSINDALSDGLYDDSWRDLFIDAITSHVLKDEISPGSMDEEEAQFILMKVQKDGKISPNGMDLLVNLSASVRSAPPFFHRFVLAALKDYVLRDGLIDEDDARMIRRVIFGSGSSSGKSIDDVERAWLRDIDNFTTQEKNHPSWSLLKLESGLTDSAQL